MNFTFDDRLTQDECTKYAELASRVLSEKKQDKEEKRKKLYKLECGIDFYKGNPVSPFIIFRWNHKTSDDIHIEIFD